MTEIPISRVTFPFPSQSPCLFPSPPASSTPSPSPSNTIAEQVGIGPGSVCTTRKKTGVGYPQLSAVIECADAAHGIGGTIISDGGCTVPGDIAKAFGAGADFCVRYNTSLTTAFSLCPKPSPSPLCKFNSDGWWNVQRS